MCKKLIFGLGTGRCGTNSLSRLLSEQAETEVTHERKPLLSWCFDLEALEFKLRQILTSDRAVVGDVAFYYLPYVEAILARHPDAKFVALRRDRGETVRSYLKKVRGKNPWIRHDGSVWQSYMWDFCYPKYEAESREEAIGRYWDDYYREVHTLHSRFPNSVRLFGLEELNSGAGVRRVLEFCGFEQITLNVGIRSNLGPTEPAVVAGQKPPEPVNLGLRRWFRERLRIPRFGLR